MGDPFLNYFALFLLIFVVVVHHRDPRHRGEDRGVTPSSPPGRDPRRRMGEPVHAGTRCGRFSGFGRWRTARNAVGGSRTSLRRDGGGAADKSSELEDLRRRVAELEKSQKTGAR